MRPRIATLVRIAALLAALSRAQSVSAQAFTSGSDGSDGALELTESGTVLFDPKNEALFGRELDVDNDNVYHFTTIHVAAGVTVRLSGDVLSEAVRWLASGDVRIDGLLDLHGTDGHHTTSNRADRVPSIPGAGGFPGGVGGCVSLGCATGLQTESGRGPGGGTALTHCECSGGHASLGGNDFLVPLFGGSGGGAGNQQYPWGPGGGAGGGGIVIASTTSVTVDGEINANGGMGGIGAYAVRGGNGSGGMIHLLAPALGGSGRLFARNSGRIRTESFSNSFAGTTDPVALRASPYAVFLPSSQPRVRVLSVGGIDVPERPTASFAAPDVTIPDGSSVPVEVAASHVPPGTAVTVHLFSENGADQGVQAVLAGTFDSSTATAVLEIPPGYSRSYVRVTFTSP